MKKAGNLGFSKGDFYDAFKAYKLIDDKKNLEKVLNKAIEKKDIILLDVFSEELFGM